MTPVNSGPRVRNHEADEFGPLPTYIELAMATAAATAYDANTAQENRMRLPRLSVIEKAIVVSIAALALYGTVLIAGGLYIKAKAELSQILSQHSFAAKLRGEDTRP
jgi:sortase A